MKAIARYCTALIAFVLTSPMIQAQRPTTHTDETNNNTTGCAAQNSCYRGTTSCQANFPGANDSTAEAGNDANPGANTVTFDAAPSNLADFTQDGVDIHNLVYPGFNGRLFANIVLWHTGPPPTGTFLYHGKAPNPPGSLSLDKFGGHFEVGYLSDNTNQVAAQLAFMQRLNIDGIVGNPPGPLPPNVTGLSTKDSEVNDAMMK